MLKKTKHLKIRPLRLIDARKIIKIINSVVEEKKYTTFLKMSERQGRQYLKSMAPNETIFIAELDGKIVGFQFVEQFPGGMRANMHVATMGTFLFKDYRKMRIGTDLAARTFNWAKKKGYEKIVIWVFEDNIEGLKFYKKLGFKPVGKWIKQVKIDDRYHNEVVLEKFLV